MKVRVASCTASNISTRDTIEGNRSPIQAGDRVMQRGPHGLPEWEDIAHLDLAGAPGRGRGPAHDSAARKG